MTRVKRITLAEAFRQQFEKRGLTARAVAERIGVVAATLRTWLKRNRFSEKAALAIAGVVGWKQTAAELLSQYSVEGNQWSHPSAGHPPVSAEVPSCGTLFPLLDRKAKRLARAMETAAASLPLLYGALNDGDLAVFVTATVTPAEMYDPPRNDSDCELLDQMARSVARGGRFLYLRPDAELIHRYRERFDSALPRDQELEDEFASLKSQIQRRVDAMPAETRQVESHLLQLVCSDTDSSFFTPGFVFGLFQTFTAALNPNCRIVVWLPKAFGGAVYLPHDAIFINRFVRFVHAILDQRVEAVVAAEAGTPAHASLVACRRLLEGKQPPGLSTYRKA